MRALLAVLLVATTASAQSGPPVVLVHGIASSDLTWQTTTDALEAAGYGVPYTVHADLNASAGTALTDEIVVSAIVPTSGDIETVPLRPDASAPLATRLVLVNFEAVFRGDTLTARVDRDAEGRSESNESGIVKQGAALGQILDDVLAATGEREAILIGHSMGGLAIREYLQRRDDEGQPRWWDARDGHRVRAVITYGTPHQGSNATNLSTSVGSGSLPDGRSEAIRDLRYTYRLTDLGAGRYLYGGPEVETDLFFAFDVDADGDLDDTVVGLNAGDPEGELAVDNPAMPLPTDIDYVYLVGRILGIGDGVVDADRQVLQRLDADGNTTLVPAGARRVITSAFHFQQTSDAATILDALAVVTVTPSAPAAPALALRVGPNPVRTALTVDLDVPRAAQVRLRVLDVRGREVARLLDASRTSGAHTVRWPVDVAPGVYLVVAEANGRRATRRVAVVD